LSSAGTEPERSAREVRKQLGVADAVQKFLSDCRARILESATIELYSDFLVKHFVMWCAASGRTELRDLSIEAVREYWESWKWAAATASRRLEQLRTFLTFCVDSGWMEKNPAKVLKPPKVKATSKMPFTDDELTRILGACDKLVTRGTYGNENRARVRAFVLILRYTGLRISDAARLDTSRVRDGKVFLRTEKTGTLVWVPIPPFVVEALDEVPRHGEFYFQTGHAEEKTVRGSWDRTLRILFKLAGVKHGSAHVFRHTLATDMLSKGIPVETVAAILGHSPAVCLKHYAPWVKSRQDALETAVRTLWPDEKPKLKLVAS
jgi:integrase